MEAEVTAQTAGAEWNIVPQNGVAAAVMALLFLYLFFRHMLFVLMLTDLVLGWLRRFRWFPKEGKRLKAAGHWAAAILLFAGYLIAAGQFGWLAFVPA